MNGTGARFVLLGEGPEGSRPHSVDQCLISKAKTPIGTFIVR